MSFLFQCFIQTYQLLSNSYNDTFLFESAKHRQKYSHRIWRSYELNIL